MYPGDLNIAMNSLKNVKGAILIQLSTYSANNDNPQNKVMETIDKNIAPHGFSRIAVVKADGNTMSLVYGRNLAWPDAFEVISESFAN